MDIMHELLQREAEKQIYRMINELVIDEERIIANSAVNALREIKEVISNEEYTDFIMVDKIVDIFTRYGISINGCHDFG